MKIGVAKEIKQDEYRVALTTAGVAELRPPRPRGAGRDRAPARAARCSDDEYVAAGASIVDVDDVWARRRRWC